jgi:SAM-dependent methyltransferase/ribosomal protein S18 acetylase RimI-like enzyme
MSSTAGRAWQIVEREGLGALALRALRRVRSGTVEISKIHFFARDLDESHPVRRPTEGVEIREGTLSDLESHPEGFDPLQSRESLHERLRRGHRFVLAIAADGSAAHTRWVTTRSALIPEIGLDVALTPGEAYFYNGFTRPEHRAQGIDGLVRSYIFEMLRSEGCRRVYSYVRDDNNEGLRAARRWQQPVGAVRYWKMRGLKHSFVDGRYRGPALVPPVEAFSRQQIAERDRAWREWFQGWLAKPLSMRSTGYSSLPPEYFSETAEYISTVLRLDSETDLALDLGCDSAMITRLVAPRCRRLVGIDLFPELLSDAVAMDVRSASGESVSFLAADGTGLPIRSGTFAKAYCCGVLQTLPSREHGLAMIEELIRVCAPGGEVLVGAVPDSAKRPEALSEAWRRSGIAGRLRLGASLALPRALKGALRRVLGRPPLDPLGILEYDLGALKRRFDSLGLECRVLDFPPGYWSRDFRRTRSNLWIRVPVKGPASEGKDARV